MEGVTAARIVSEFGVNLGVFISGDLDEIVPVHNRSYLELEPVLLLDFLVWSSHNPLVLHFLAGALSAVVEE